MFKKKKRSYYVKKIKFLKPKVRKPNVISYPIYSPAMNLPLAVQRPIFPLR